MATTIRRTPLITPISNWRAARDQATFAAAIVGFTVAGFTAATLSLFDSTHVPHNLTQEKPWQKATVFTSAYGSPRALLSAPPPAAAPFAQKDWPNPVLRVQARQADSSGFSTPIRAFAIGLNTPNQRQIDWPNPRGPQRSISLLTWTQPKTLLPPFAETDWPNPVRAVYRQQDQITWTQNLLQTTLAQVSPPFRQADWQNPRGALPARQAETSGFDTPIRAYATGLNTAAKPQLDWPNPRGSVPNIVLRTWVDGSKLTLQPPTAVPENQYQWPNPAGPRRSGDLGQVGSGLSLTAVTAPADTTTLPHALIHDAAWQKATGYRSVYGSTQLLSTAVAAAPFFETEWPNPRGTLPARQAESSGFDTPIRSYADGLNVANNPKPDWPNPRGPAPRAVDTLTWTQSLAAEYVAAAVKPFLQSDWPLQVPRVYRQIAESRGFEQPILNYAVGLNTGLGIQRDWPVPRGPARSIDALTWTQTLALQITAAGTKPFLQTDWPLAVPRVYRQIADTTGFSEPILNYAVGLNTAAKRPYDWPVPKGPARSIDALTWTQTLALQATPAVVVNPFVQDDWPVPIPRVYRQIADTVGFSTPIRGYAVGLNDANRRKYDWPNPTGKPPLHVGWASGFSRPINDIQTLRLGLRQYDWPVPKGRPPLNVGRVSGFDASKLGSYVPFAYLRQYDWPVPKGPRRAIDLLTAYRNAQMFLPPGIVAVCAHVDVLYTTASVDVVFGTADLDVLTGSGTTDVTADTAETEVLTPTSETDIEECPE